MFKIANASVRGSQVHGLLRYVSRTGLNDKAEENLELEDQSGAKIQGKEEIKDLYEEWRTRFERADNNKTSKPRHVLHMIFSAKCEKSKENIEKIFRAAKETMKAEFAGYDYVFGLHQDSKHPHIHVVICCKSRDRDLPKLRLNKPELLRIRTLWAKNLTREGLAHVATLRLDRPKTLQRVKDGLEPEKNRKTWFQATLQDVRQGVELLEKRRQQFEASKPLAGYGSEIYAEIQKLKTAIRGQTKQGDKARLDSFAFLRRFERDFREELQNRNALEQLYRSLGKESPAVQKILSQVKLEGPAPRQRDRAGRDLVTRRVAASVTRARQALEQAKLPPDKLDLAQKALAIHEREVQRILGLAWRDQKKRGKKLQDRSRGRG